MIGPIIEFSDAHEGDGQDFVKQMGPEVVGAFIIPEDVREHVGIDEYSVPRHRWGHSSLALRIASRKASKSAPSGHPPTSFDHSSVGYTFCSAAKSSKDLDSQKAEDVGIKELIPDGCSKGSRSRIIMDRIRPVGASTVA